MPVMATTRTVRIVAALAVVVALLVAWRLGLLGQLSDPARAARMMADLGGWGYLAFVVSYAVFQPFGVPGTVFILVAPLIWPWPVAFALSMTGTMAASVIGFSFSRLIAREWVRSIIPPQFRKYDDALAERAFATVFLLRLVFWMPPLLHAFFGISKVRFSTHFWGSLLGYVPPIFLVSFFGQRVVAALVGAPLWAWLALAAVAVVTAVGAWALRRRRPAQKDLGLG
jgi:uncharacterized membrane protein YdjX (TVP38/TMEM64 family)